MQVKKHSKQVKKYFYVIYVKTFKKNLIKCQQKENC